MTITRADVADLREGDVVELRFPSGSTVRGPLTTNESYGPGLGIPDVGWSVRDREGNPGWFTSLGASLTVVSRAPRPLYVNHPRAEPVPGDVVRDAEMETRTRVWSHLPHAAFLDEPWVTQSGNEPIRLRRSELPARLRLLVDGETGTAVTP